MDDYGLHLEIEHRGSSFSDSINEKSSLYTKDLLLTDEKDTNSKPFVLYFISGIGFGLALSSTKYIKMINSNIGEPEILVIGSFGGLFSSLITIIWIDVEI